MLKEIVKNKVYYRIFDNTTNDGSGICDRKILRTPIDEEAAAAIAQTAKNLAVKELVLLDQIHSNVVVLQKTYGQYSSTRPKADAIVTELPNIALGIYTADCVPVLLSSQNGDVIAAAHCGWKGAKADIIKNTVDKMQSYCNDKIIAVIGPAIAQKSYEVSTDFYNDFLQDNLGFDKFFVASVKAGHYMFDLPAFVIEKLTNAGVEVIEYITDDTYSMPEKYPSYRRSTHTGEGYNKNILSVLVKTTLTN